MVRRGRDEIGKVGGAAGEVLPMMASSTPPPPPPPCAIDPKGGEQAVALDLDDEEAAVRAFDAALSLCANEGSDAPVDAVRALFAAAAQRAAESRWRRDTMEDCCNEEAAKNQAAAAELAKRRAAASRAEASKIALEAKCREQAQLNQLTVEHVKTAKAAEEARIAELQEKFDTAVPGIQEKLKVEAERRQRQRKDNEELRGKLVSFAEQAKLSKEACAAQLTPASLRIEIAKAKCEQQEAKRRAGDARADSLEVELERAKASHAKLKADTIARERSLSKIQNILNERKAMSSTLEAKIKELVASRTSMEAECVVLRELAANEEARAKNQNMVERLRGLCSRLELDVADKRLNLAAPSLSSLCHLRVCEERQRHTHNGAPCPGYDRTPASLVAASTATTELSEHGAVTAPASRENGAIRENVKSSFQVTLSGTCLGVLGSLPLFAYGLALQKRRDWAWVRRAQAKTEQVVLELFGSARQVTKVTAVSIPLTVLVGISEECGLRGFLPLILAAKTGLPMAAVVVVSGVFCGLLHAVSVSYFINAALNGMFFHGLLLFTGNIWVPIVAHAVHNSFVLVRCHLKTSRPR
eukprot:g12658.t1